jgi:hypothetical protein
VVLVERLGMGVEQGMERVVEEELSKDWRSFLALVYVSARVRSYYAKVPLGCSFSISAS